MSYRWAMWDGEKLYRYFTATTLKTSNRVMNMETSKQEFGRFGLFINFIFSHNGSVIFGRNEEYRHNRHKKTRGPDPVIPECKLFGKDRDKHRRKGYNPTIRRCGRIVCLHRIVM